VADDLMRTTTDAHAPAAQHIGTSFASDDESSADRARRLAYRSRFSVLFVALSVIAGIGIGALIVLVTRGAPVGPDAWSAWKPIGSTERRSAQIGEHVSAPYRLPSGKPLAVVLFAGPPTVTGPDGTTFSVRALAVQPDTTGGRAEATDIDTVDASTTVMYTLCGLGESCAIAEGKPSIPRGQLLRREALELALYSFKYLDGIDSTLVLLPPRPDGKVATAVFLRRSDVKPMLDKPLDQTLITAQTPGVGQIHPAEAQVIDRVTLSRLYEYSYLQAQDGSPVMVLTPAFTG
jgi:hypothetical protein